MEFDHGEFPPEVPEEVPEEVEEEGLSLEIIIETEPILKQEELIIEKSPEYVPQDDYLQKHLERESQEKLGKMIPKRIP